MAHAEILIIGGGVVGCSIAYHLSKMGKRDVVLLEKSGLTHGATWHAAGLVGQLRGKRNLTRLMQYSARLYGQLEAETGQATDWHPVGSIRVASSKARWQEIKRTATTARSFGFELELITAKEAQALYPLMSTDGVHGAAWIAGDGYIDPSSLTQAYAKGARQGGARLLEGVTVKDIVVKHRRVVEVITDQGSWSCEVLVNAAGLWAREVAAMAGARLPAGVVEHQYLVTEKVADLPKDLPTFRDPDHLFYVKPEVGGIALGGWEPNTLALTSMPPAFSRELLESNVERFEQISLKAAQRMPMLNTVGVRTLINGPIPVSPDGEPIMGPLPELDNVFVACGFTAGIAASGGAGKALAEWIVDGEPEFDIWTFDARRFGPQHATRQFLAARCVETYGRYYRIHWPVEELQSARGLRRSPLYERLKQQGAVYGSKFGWERPNWFAPIGVAPVDSHAFDREDTNWFEPVSEEHHSVREQVGLIDQTSFAQLEVSGEGALDALQYLAVSNIDRPVGSVIYTQLCNEHGGIEADLTMMRIAEQRFYLVTGSGFGIHDFHWVTAHLPRDGSVIAKDAGLAVLNICGPDARQVLSKVSDSPLDNAGFPFAHCREIEIGMATVLAARIGYVGELGWELHMPMEYLLYVYEQLWQAGQDFDIANVGYRAIDCLRMEKGYLYWSADITPDYNPFELGLGGRVHLKSKGDFLGREALERIKAGGVKRRLCTFTVDAPNLLYGSEPILRQGRVVGSTSSANYGHTVAKQIAYGCLPIAETAYDDFEIEAFGERYPARRHDGPLYDPQMSRLKS